MSRGPRIAHNLIENSIEAMYCAIELHNKPILKYRYESCTILIVNSWELILKAYLYQVKKDKKMMTYLKKSLQDQKKEVKERTNDSSDWKTSFNILVDKVFTGKDNQAIVENIKYINKLRNDFIHAYIDELNPILYALICKNIIEYQNFIKQHFKKDLSAHSDLVLLPIGFSKPINIADYLSNGSNIKTSKIAKEIFEISKRLEEQKVDDSILVNFHISMNTANKISNPDLIVSIGSNGESIEKIVKLKFDPSGQSTGNIPISELEKKFVIPAKSLQGKIRETLNSSIQIKKYQSIHKKYRDGLYHAKYWWRNPNSMRLFWSQEGFDILQDEYRTLLLDTSS